MNKPLTLITSILGILTLSNIASASTTEILQPAQTITYNEDLTVNGTGRFDSVYIGKQGTGGVTFFNGTIINNTIDTNGNDISVTFGDNVRIDGYLHGGPTLGYSDERALKIGDHIYPGLDNSNDFGKDTHRFRNASFAGDVTVGNLLGSGVVDYSNLDTSNTGSANQILSYNGTDLEWITVGTSSSDDTDDTSTITVGDITSVTAGDGLDGGGTEGGVTLSVDDDLSVTTLITTGNITVGGDVDGVDVSNENAVYYSTTGGSDTYLTTPTTNPYPSKIIAGIANVSASGGFGCPAPEGCSDTIELPSNFFTSNTSYNVTANQNNPILTDSELGDLYISRTDGDTFKVYWSSNTYPANAKIQWQAIGY